MEHPLHAALTVAFTGVLLRGLERERAALGDTVVLWLLASMLPLVRLEGAFAVGAGALLLLLRRRLRPAVGVLLAELGEAAPGQYQQGLKRAVELLAEANAAQFHDAYRAGYRAGFADGERAEEARAARQQPVDTEDTGRC
jgi:hypothetical protein